MHLKSDKASIDTPREVLIDTLDDHHDKTQNDPVIVNMDINVASHLTQTDVGSSGGINSSWGVCALMLL